MDVQSWESLAGTFSLTSSHTLRSPSRPRSRLSAAVTPRVLHTNAPGAFELPSCLQAFLFEITVFVKYCNLGNMVLVGEHFSSLSKGQLPLLDLCPSSSSHS